MRNCMFSFCFYKLDFAAEMRSEFIPVLIRTELLSENNSKLL